MSTHPSGGSGPVSSTRIKLILGAAVSLGGVLAVRGLGVISTVVLARILTPEDFGLAAMSMVVLGFVTAITENQFNDALIQRGSEEAVDYDTAFTLNLLFGAASMAFIFTLAPVISGFFNEPRIENMLRVLSSLPLIAALRNPYFIRHRMALNVTPEVIANAGPKLLMAITAIALALALNNAWALIWGTVVFYLGRTVVTHMWSERLPGLGLHDARAFMGFGLWLTGSAVLDYLAKKIPTIATGRVFGPVETGIYNIGAELSVTTLDQLIRPLRVLVFPALSAMRDDAARRSAAFAKAQASLLAVGLPMGIGMAMVAPELIRLGLGDKWMEAVPVIQILAPASGINSLILGVGGLAMAMGQTRAIFWRNFWVVVVLVPLVLGGITWGGLMGAVLGLAAGMLFQLWITLVVAARLVGTGLWQQLAFCWRSFVSVAAMAAVLWACNAILQPRIMEMSISGLAGLLAFKVVLGSVVYGGVHMVAWVQAGRPDGFESTIMGLIRRRRRPS